MRVLITIFSGAFLLSATAQGPCTFSEEVPVLETASFYGGRLLYVDSQEPAWVGGQPPIKLYVYAGTEYAPNKYTLRVEFLTSAQQVLGQQYPEHVPSDMWVCAVLQLAVRDAGPASVLHCIMTNQVHNYWLVEYQGLGAKSFDISWLYADVDNDGINNLLDYDQYLECVLLGETAPADFGGCNGVVIAPGDVGEGQVLGDYAGQLPNAVQITGPTSQWFGCELNPVYGGGVEVGGGVSYSEDYAEWLSTRFKVPEVLGTPATPRPYTTAYYLSRAGEGAAESGYISAPWGQQLSYVDRNDTTVASKPFEYLETFYWHRYVMIEDKFSLQYYRESQGCWMPIGIGYIDTGGSEDWGANDKLLLYLSYVALSAYVPAQYMPGAIYGEAESNDPFTEGGVPTASGQAWTYYQGRGRETGNGARSGLTEQEAYSAMRKAMLAASANQAVDNAKALGAAFGQGGGEAADYIFGEGASEEGDGGATEGLAEGIGDDSAALETRLRDYLKLDQITPTEQSYVSWEMSIPWVDGGNLEVGLSALPDTSTPVGVALEGMRLLLRTMAMILIIFWASEKLLQLYRDIV